MHGHDALALREVFEAMIHGVLWTDEQLAIQGMNKACIELFRIHDPVTLIGQPLHDTLLAGCPWLPREDSRHIPRKFDHPQPEGRMLRITMAPLNSGGYAVSCSDITHEAIDAARLRNGNKATIIAMANLAEHRDTDTGAHVLRVARMVWQIARELHRRGLHPEIVDTTFVEHIALASTLHDVGKIALSDNILLKPGPLTEDEKRAMQRHTADGARLLRQSHLALGDNRFIDLGEEIALTHHERYDGTGYPNGLTGNDIPLAGRICAIADVFDALISRRPYKDPWADERALAYIGSLAGSHFDPQLVEIFVTLMADRTRVSLIHWAESMSVANPQIDEQHALLIDIINQLASAADLDDRPMITLIIDELIAYAAFHFSFEEQMLEACRYPHLDRHKRIHHNFVGWISNLRNEFETGRRHQLGDLILGYLRDWLREHILGEDRRYMSFINSDSPSPIPGHMPRM